MKYLVSTTEVYRVETEPEVAAMIDAAKADNRFELTKYNCEVKPIKEKGEGVVGEYYKLTLVKSFNDIKDPITMVEIDYEVD